MRSVGEAAKTILRSRAEEGEAPGNPAPQKPIDDTSSPDDDASPPDEKRLHKKIKSPSPASDSQASPTRFPEEILPVVDKKIALEGMLSQESSKVLPVVEQNVVQTKVFNNFDINGN
jgi:hypothetical protein